MDGSMIFDKEFLISGLVKFNDDKMVFCFPKKNLKMG